MKLIDKAVSDITEYFDIYSRDNLTEADRRLFVSKLEISIKAVGDKRYSEGYNDAIEDVAGVGR